MIEPITTTILGTLILKGAASGLGQILGKATGNIALSAISRITGVTVPGLPQKVQEDSRYQEAMAAYFNRQLQLRQQEIQLKEQELQAHQKYVEREIQLKEEQLQLQQEFNQKLLELLGEWQANANNNKLIEIQHEWDNKDNWISKLNRQETLEILGQARHNLLILVSQPEISEDCPDSFKNNLKIEIRNEMKIFLNQYYSEVSSCPVKFYGDYFKVSISDIGIEQLHTLIGNVPAGIISSQITDYRVYLNLAFWSLQSSSPVEFSLPVWNWKDTYIELKKQSKTDTEAWQEIRQAIIMACQLLTGFIADWYYLHINPFYEPQLFKLESHFPSEWIAAYLEQLREPYQLNQAGFYYEQGLQLAEAKLYEEAIASFDKALEFHPQLEEAWYKRGLALSEIGSAEKAIASFDRVIEINPNRTDCWCSRGKLMQDLGQLEEAIASFEKALQINPNDDELWWKWVFAFQDLRYVKLLPKRGIDSIRDYLNNTLKILQELCLKLKNLDVDSDKIDGFLERLEKLNYQSLIIGVVPSFYSHRFHVIDALLGKEIKIVLQEIIGKKIRIPARDKTFVMPEKESVISADMIDLICNFIQIYYENKESQILGIFEDGTEQTLLKDNLWNINYLKAIKICYPFEFCSKNKVGIVQIHLGNSSLVNSENSIAVLLRQCDIVILTKESSISEQDKTFIEFFPENCFLVFDTEFIDEIGIIRSPENLKEKFEASRIFFLSTKQALKAKLESNADLLARSRFPEFEAELEKSITILTARRLLQLLRHLADMQSMWQMGLQIKISEFERGIIVKKEVTKESQRMKEDIIEKLSETGEKIKDIYKKTHSLEKLKQEYQDFFRRENISMSSNLFSFDFNKQYILARPQEQVLEELRKFHAKLEQELIHELEKYFAGKMIYLDLDELIIKKKLKEKMLEKLSKIREIIYFINQNIVYLLEEMEAKNS